MRRRLLLTALSALATLSTVAPVAHAAFPGQNGRIAYVTTVGDHRAIYTVDAQGADTQPLIDLGSGRDAINPMWSRDGLRVAFAGRESPGGPFVIYTANAEGTGTLQQVTRDDLSPGMWRSDTDPTWSPDGTRIAFVRTLTDQSSSIWTVDLETGSTSPLRASAGVEEKEPAWSPDGSRIAFAARRFTCAAAVSVGNPDLGCRSRPVHQLPQVPALPLRLAPSGLVTGWDEDRGFVRPG